MKEIGEIRRDSLSAIADANFKNRAEFAEAIGRSETQVSRFLGKNPTKEIGTNLARDIEESLGLQRGYLDNLHDCSMEGIEIVPALTLEQAAYMQENIRENNILGYEPLPKSLTAPGKSFVFVRVNDDSMLLTSDRRSLAKGDDAIVEVGATPSPGDIVLAKPDGADTSLIRVYMDRGNGAFDLAPKNESYPRLKFNSQSECIITGVLRKISISF